MDQDARPVLLPPISNDVIEAIVADLPPAFVGSQTTDLQAGFMLGVQHAIDVMKKHAKGGVK